MCQTFHVSTHLILTTFYYLLFMNEDTEAERLYDQPINTCVCGCVCMKKRKKEHDIGCLASPSCIPTTPKGVPGIFIWFSSSISYPQCSTLWPFLLYFLHGTIIFLKYISDSVPPWFGTFAGSSLFLGTWSIHHSPVLHFHHHSSDLLL